MSYMGSMKIVCTGTKNNMPLILDIGDIEIWEYREFYWKTQNKSQNTSISKSTLTHLRQMEFPTHSLLSLYGLLGGIFHFLFKF